tara:strand:+ start:166 stop:1023 length:858 start_codon:yes stop_codon:yes gene_type:complete
MENIVSTFDGISCLQIALNRQGLEYKNYYASEIDTHCIKIAQKNYPNTIQKGNICDLTKADFPENIDLLVGGSPCQGFSLMGRQLNFNDDRSKLFFEFVRLKDELNPKWFILENVVMRQDIQDAISDLLGVKPIKINSALFSGQNRKRLYWTNIPNVEEKIAQSLASLPQITGKSILTDQTYEIATVRKGKNGSPRQIVKPATDKLGCLTASYYKGVNADGRPAKSKFFGDYEAGKIEMLSPVECERLQTVPEGYTEGISKTQRYKALGNGFTVEVISFILGCIP